MKLIPRPHQNEATNAATTAIQGDSRATIVMACGTGKTLVELMCVEALKPARTLVLVPSLYLLQQTLNVWKEQNSAGDKFNYLCVCSDSGIDNSDKDGEDEIIVDRADLDFPTSTDPDVVSRFLDASPPDASTVVFCTYQSVSVVATAMRGRIDGNFDLAIFDEAHKTVGAAGKSFGYALHDQNIQINKRLFFTATPRVLGSGKSRSSDGDLLVSSMEDASLYGQRAYTLSFAEAARRKIIVPYKIIISILDDDLITSDVVNESSVGIDGRMFEAKEVANMKAMTDVMHRYGLKKAITFHSRVRSAEKFSEIRPDLSGMSVPGLKRFYVSGRQTSTERKIIMDDFVTSEFGSVSNARCLTEGVDTPAVDLVAFMDPKSSKVDIVQAAGRSMRPSDGKTCGYIFLPLHLNRSQGESIASALDRSNYRQISEVLTALSENDEVLHDHLRNAGIQIGVKEGDEKFSPPNSGLIEWMAGGLIDSAEVMRAVQTQLISEVTDTWDVMFGRLKSFYEKNGDCDVPRSDVVLGNWVAKQRELAKLPDFPAHRRALLDSIGFTYQFYRDAWSNHFASVLAFHKKHKHSNVPATHPEGLWVAKQRIAYRAGKLSASRIEAFSAIGFDFNRGETIKFERGLKDFLDSWRRNDKQVSRMNGCQLKWLNEQVQLSDSGKMNEHTRALFAKNGIPLYIDREGQWLVSFTLLSDFIQDNGHTVIPKMDPLNRWFKFQKKTYREGAMSQERLDKFSAIGVVFEGGDQVEDFTPDAFVRESQRG